MAISITHAFTSLKGDGGDATLVKPSHWNAAHSTSIATQKLVGRLTAGTGAFEEITLTTYMASLLAATDKETLAGLLGVFETGDVKYTFKPTASAGWLLVTAAGSIGNAVSAATLRANADCLALFVLIYGSCADAQAPVSGGRTGNATNDFNAGKRLTIPQLVGRAPVGAGAGGAGTSARTLGAVAGAETVTLAVNQIPAGVPSSNVAQAIAVTGNGIGMHVPASGAATVGVPGDASIASFAAVSAPSGWVDITNFSGSNSIAVTSTNGAQAAVDNMPPVIPLNAMVKL